MINFETIQSHGRNAARGLGSLIMREVVHKHIIPEGLLKIDINEINAMIAEEATEYGYELPL